MKARHSMALLALGPLAALAAGTAAKDAAAPKVKVYSTAKGRYIMADKVVKTDEEWKKLLTPLQYKVARRKGTEQAFTGEYWDHHEKGVYRCVCCGSDLFASGDKFDSGTGWPSFTRPVAPENVENHEDRTLWLRRTEIVCSRCGCHLGHAFDDGPKPTGLRYCINSASLRFEKAK